MFFLKALIYIIITAFSASSFADITQVYEQRNTYLNLSPEVTEKGYVVSAGDPLRLVFPSTRPLLTDINKPLSTFVSLGEVRSVVFSVMGLKTLGKAEVVASDLTGKNGVISKNNLQVRIVKYGVRQGLKWWPRQHRNSMVVPMYLQSSSTFSINQNITQQIWVTITVPEDTLPGVYEGIINIIPNEAEKDYLQIKLEVLPVKLARVDHYFLSLYMHLSEQKDSEYYKRAVLDMKSYGLTALAIIGDLDEMLTLENSKAKVNWSGKGQFELAMNAVTNNPLGNSDLLWLMAGRNLGDIYPWCKKQERAAKISFDDCYTQIIEQIEARKVTLGWPDIIYQPIDEPSIREKSSTVAIETYPVIKKIPGVRTEMNSASNKYSIPVNRKLRNYIDIYTFHSGPYVKRGMYDKKSWQILSEGLRRDGKKIWFYNMDNTGWHTEPMRYAFGFGLFGSGGEGMLQWSYQVPVYYVFKGDGQRFIDNTKYHVYMYPPNKTDGGGPSLGYEMIREGINDLRYIETLRELIRSNDIGALHEGASVYWNNILNEINAIDYSGAKDVAVQGHWSSSRIDADGVVHVSGDLKMENGLKYEDYDRIRGLIAEYIINLTKNKNYGAEL